ncbi:Zn(II)2Cys6 transcription factor, partial [Aspergillus ibericus CBS 121593]
CDQVKPSCSQCIRAKVECPGYRSALEYNFRDQSQDVIRKAQRQAQKESEAIIHKRPTNGTRFLDADSRALSSTLSHPMEELARGYIFTNYISRGNRGAYMPYLSTLIKHLENLAVNDALSAAGMAALSNIYMSPQLMSTARKYYMSALSQTGRTLRTATLCKKDGTLAAVVLLGMFELMTCSDELFLTRWMKHLDGAATLIEARGPEQLTRPEGLELFSQLRAQIILSHIYRQKYTSPIIGQLSMEAATYRSGDDATVDRLSSVTIQLGNLCAAIKDGTINQPAEILRAALQLDAEFMSIMSTIPASWNYETVNVALARGEPTVDSIWGAQHHTYRNLTVSSFWNNYRSARLVLRELIVEAAGSIKELSSDDTNGQEADKLVSESREISRRLVDDICASVPFHLGTMVDDSHLSKLFSNTATESSPFPDNHHEFGSPFLSSASSPFGVPAAGGFTIMWPLLIAANSGYASKQRRQWITDCLAKIGHSMGIRQALAMAQLLQDGVDSRAWLSSRYRPAVSGQEYSGTIDEAEAE